MQWLSSIESKQISLGLFGNSSSMSQMPFGSTTQDWSSVGLLSSLFMAQEVLDDFFKTNQTLQFAESFLTGKRVKYDFRQNLDV